MDTTRTLSSEPITECRGSEYLQYPITSLWYTFYLVFILENSDLSFFRSVHGIVTTFPLFLKLLNKVQICRQVSK